MFQKLMQMMNKYSEWIWSCILLLPVSLSFLLNPLTNDARCYSGLARITDFFGPFPQNIDLAWEVKPIGNRFLNYILYKLSILFTEFGTIPYEFVFKLFVLIIVFLICYYFSTKINKKYMFLLTSLAFITPLTFITLQPDWWAILFTILSFSLFLTDNRSNWYLSGAVITFIFLLKGSTIFLVLPIAFALLLMKDNVFSRLEFGAFGSIISLAFILSCGYFDNIIPDMLMSATIAKVGAYDIITMFFNFIQNLTISWLYIPILFSGIFSAYFLYVKEAIKNKDFVKGIIIMSLWISSGISTFIQSEFFLYHYVTFIFASIITIVLLSNNAIKYSIIIMYIIFILFTAYWGIGMNVEREFYGDQWSDVSDIRNNITDIMDQDTILYIDSGVAPYYFPSNTSCRYTQPLPFQRNSEYWNTTMLSQYKEEFDCIMNYNGKYIIEDENNWMKQNTTDNKIVWNKINTEYEKVWALNWNIYRRIES